ncbi:MAG: LPS translocon maturation chaperone LptM [Methylococcales bacterium]
MSKAKFYAIAGFSVLLFSSAGCGQKGPLYLEKDTESAAKPMKNEEKQPSEQRKASKHQDESQPEITK